MYIDRPDILTCTTICVIHSPSGKPWKKEGLQVPKDDLKLRIICVRSMHANCCLRTWMVALDAGDRRMFNKLDMSRAIFFLRESPVSLFIRRKAQIELDLNEILLSSGDREDQGLRSIRQKPFLHWTLKQIIAGSAERHDLDDYDRVLDRLEKTLFFRHVCPEQHRRLWIRQRLRRKGETYITHLKRHHSLRLNISIQWAVVCSSAAVLSIGKRHLRLIFYVLHRAAVFHPVIVLMIRSRRHNKTLRALMTVDVCFSGNATRDKIGGRGGERGMNREWKTKAQDRECQRGKRRWRSEFAHAKAAACTRPENSRKQTDNQSITVMRKRVDGCVLREKERY